MPSGDTRRLPPTENNSTDAASLKKPYSPPALIRLDAEIVASKLRARALSGDTQAQKVLPGWVRTLSTHTERRRSPRIRVRISVLLLWEENQQQHREHTFTVTLSWFGCSVHSHKFFRPGTCVQLQRDNKTMDARVAHSLWDHSTNLKEVGLAFDQDGREFWGIPVWAE